MKTKKVKLNDVQEFNPSQGNVQFALERYKFILSEIHSLNENFHRYLTVFQALATAILGVAVSLFVSRQSLHIAPEIATVGIRGLLGLLGILSLFVIILLVSGLFSWFDYRKEEVELINRFLGLEFRKLPKIKNFWRWHETYLLLFIILFNGVVLIFVEKQIIPLIK